MFQVDGSWYQKPERPKEVLPSARTLISGKCTAGMSRTCEAYHWLPGHNSARPSSPISDGGVENESTIFIHEARTFTTVVGFTVHTTSPDAWTLLRSLPWRRCATEPE